MAASRGRKIWIVLLILVVVLGGLFVAADRIAAYAAERTIASQAKKELVARDITSPSDPTVGVGGFPFLTQVAQGRYDKITIHVDHPSSQGITLDNLQWHGRVFTITIGQQSTQLRLGSGSALPVRTPSGSHLSNPAPKN